ncbi:MAG: 2Fe-2S iron-sulfur cluster-binding protein [Alphaproteobacteria bacterium]|nr:2Fe-2S iron-sulfur cluster-binding protein [Alphaproteobacteria bacterium]
MSDMPATATIRVQRGVAGEAPRFEAFEVPYREGMSVLDALMWIRANRDSSLAIRYSCINANACKECMVEVDGKTQYACTARLGTAGVTVGPLGNKRLLRDLVTDIVPPKETLANALDDIER